VPGPCGLLPHAASWPCARSPAPPPVTVFSLFVFEAEIGIPAVGREGCEGEGEGQGESREGVSLAANGIAAQLIQRLRLREGSAARGRIPSPSPRAAVLSQKFKQEGVTRRPVGASRGGRPRRRAHHQSDSAAGFALFVRLIT
jgi:hypothetical protein